MARVFIDGFESGSYDLWDDWYAATVIAAPAGFDGAYCVELGDSYARLTKNLPGAAEYYFAFRYQPLSGYSVYICKFLDASGTVLGCLKCGDGRGKVSAYRGTGTLLASGSMILGWTVSRIEVRYKPHATAGIFQVKVDGVLEIDFSGNTGTTTNIGGLQIGDDVLQFNCKGRWDNIIVDDAGWVGDTMIQALMPNGAGNSAQWDPSTGSNYACVDEKPPSDTDFNSTDVVNDLDLFTVTSLSGSPDAVKSVAVQARCLAEGAPTPTKIKMALRTASTDYVGADKAPQVGLFRSEQGIWNNNPNTSAPWQPADAFEAGYKAVA